MPRLPVLTSTLLCLLNVCWAEMVCWDYLVSGPQGVPDDAFSASSYHLYNVNGHHYPACSRLYTYNQRNSSGCPAPNYGAWCPTWGESDPYIQVEFADLKKIVGIFLQQKYSPVITENDIRTYQVLYSENGKDWDYAKSESDDQIKVPQYDPLLQTFYGPTDPGVNAQRYSRLSRLWWPDSGRRRFTYLPLPAGSISDDDVIGKGRAKHLGECSLRCHHDVTCHSFSFKEAYKDCITYRFKYTQKKSRTNERTISNKPYLYYFDMTNIDLYMTTDPTTGLIYKVIKRWYNQEDAMTACEELDMRLLVVNSEDKLNLLDRVKSSSLILEQKHIRTGGGWYEVDGVKKWWDGGDPPQPLNDQFLAWNTRVQSVYGTCLYYNNNELRRKPCEKKHFSICEIS